VAHDLKTHALSLPDLMARLGPEADPAVLRHGLAQFGHAVDVGAGGAAGGLWCLERDKVAAFRLHQVFKQRLQGETRGGGSSGGGAGGTVGAVDLLADWELALPLFTNEEANAEEADVGAGAVSTQAFDPAEFLPSLRGVALVVETDGSPVGASGTLTAAVLASLSASGGASGGASGAQLRLRYFPEKDLPLDPAQRFARLFG